MAPTKPRSVKKDERAVASNAVTPFSKCAVHNTVGQRQRRGEVVVGASVDNCLNVSIGRAANRAINAVANNRVKADQRVNGDLLVDTDADIAALSTSMTELVTPRAAPPRTRSAWLEAEER